MKIKNFKSIGEKGVELELKPLTLLVGPNASGKSNILEALCLFVQSIGASQYDYRGESYPQLVRYLNFEDIFHKHDSEKIMNIELHVALEENEKRKLLEISEEINKRGLGVSIDKEITSVGYSYGCCMLRHKWYYVEQGVFCNEKKIIEIKREYKEISEYSASYKDVFISPSILNTANPGPSQPILYPATFEQSTNVIEPAKPLINFAKVVIDILISKLKPSKSKVYFISALRGKIDYKIGTDKWHEWVGKRGENLISILAQLAKPEYKEKKEKVEKWASEFGIKDVWAGWSGPNEASSKYLDSELNVPLNLAFASYGSSQILTVITQLFFSEKGDIILIEEPEISIHPEGQAKLPEIFAEAINEGKQIIITTHSAYLPLALNRALKKGLKANDIAVYEVEKDKEGTKVKKREVDENGYIKGYIESFYDVEEKLTREWAESISKSFEEEVK
ncbi:MAG: AAA family ATPase [Candidatus Methanomethylicaceae archaeon]